MASPVDVAVRDIDPSRRLSLDETWRVGHVGDPSGTQLYRVRGGAVGSAGSVFVLDSGNDRVVVIDSAGTVIRRFGSRGAGPGEFEGAARLVVQRDTVLVSDSNGRVHFFDVEGRLLATYRPRFEDQDVNHLSMIAASPDGWLVSALGYFRGGTVDEPPLHREYVYRVDPRTGDIEAAGLRWSRESSGESHNDFFWLEPILTHRPTLSPDGLGRVLVADTATYRIDVYGTDGVLRLRIEGEVDPIPIDRGVLELWRASRDCPAGPEMVVECSREIDRKTLSLPRTAHRPVVLRIRAYRTGHFSILRGDLDPNPFDGESVQEYDHFGPDGVFLGSTSGTTPLSFDGQIMISLERDPRGVESVVRYRVASP